jgi:hypothetical protein
MIDVECRVEIGRARHEVAAFASNPDFLPEWRAGVVRVEWRSPRPVAEGAKLDIVAIFRGSHIRFLYEVTAFVPRERLVIRTAQGPVPHEHSLEWESNGEGSTVMRLRTRAMPAGLQALLAPALTKTFEREGKRDLESLKRLMETATLTA